MSRRVDRNADGGEVRPRLFHTAERREMARRRPSKGKTAARWRGPEGEALAHIVDDIRYSALHTARRKHKGTWEEVWRELKKRGYAIHADPNKLKADYHTGSAYREKRRWAQALCGSEGRALIDLVFDLVDGTPADNGSGELDWRFIKNNLHPGDPRMTPGKLKERYESAAKFWLGRYRNDAMCIAEDFLRRAGP
jgi:hypothetical protein